MIDNIYLCGSIFVGVSQREFITLAFQRAQDWADLLTVGVERVGQTVRQQPVIDELTALAVMADHARLHAQDVYEPG